MRLRLWEPWSAGDGNTGISDFQRYCEIQFPSFLFLFAEQLGYGPPDNK